MADIELVIKIPEEIYKASQIIDAKYKDVIQIPLEVIANSTPLPKGHGALKDVDKLKLDVFEYDEDAWMWVNITKSGYFKKQIESLETIIEANSNS